ncbi:MAG: hypothetical protein ACYDCO_23255 [Armatimonadota bacterium]
MVTTRQQYTEAFGIVQVFTLGTVLLVGACLAIPIQMLPLSMLSTSTADIVLWIVEAVLYLALSWWFSRNTVGVLVGVGLGLGTRFVANILIFLLSSTSFTELFAFGGRQGVAHMVAVVVAVLALVLSFRALLINLGIAQQLAPKDNEKKTRMAFDNRVLTPSPTRPPAPVHVPLVLSPEDGISTPTERPATHLQPPEDFNAIFAREDTPGTLTIPASVILESVPEAKTILAPGYGISIRLAYIVPQLPRGTVWLTWKQVFEKGVPPMANVDTARLEPEFISRWIRLSPKHYVTQVPSSYFKTKKTTPAWLSLPEVEQEAEITFKA